MANNNTQQFYRSVTNHRSSLGIRLIAVIMVCVFLCTTMVNAAELPASYPVSEPSAVSFTVSSSQLGVALGNSQTTTELLDGILGVSGDPNKALSSLMTVLHGVQQDPASAVRVLNHEHKYTLLDVLRQHRTGANPYPYYIYDVLEHVINSYDVRQDVMPWNQVLGEVLEASEVLFGEPNNTEKLNQIADVLCSYQLWDKAEDVYSRILSVDHNNTQARNGLARKYAQTGALFYALDEYAAVLRIDEDNVIAQYAIADIQASLLRQYAPSDIYAYIKLWIKEGQVSKTVKKDLDVLLESNVAERINSLVRDPVGAEILAVANERFILFQRQTGKETGPPETVQTLDDLFAFILNYSRDELFLLENMYQNYLFGGHHYSAEERQGVSYAVLDDALQPLLNDLCASIPFFCRQTSAIADVLQKQPLRNIGEGNFFLAFANPQEKIIVKYLKSRQQIGELQPIEEWPPDQVWDRDYSCIEDAEGRYVLHASIWKYIRSLEIFGTRIVPSIVCIAKDTYTALHYQEKELLKRYIDSGIVRILDAPVRITPQYPKDFWAAKQVDEITVSVMVVQPEVVSLKSSLIDLLQQGKTDEAEDLLSQYIPLLQDLWRHGIFDADMSMVNVGVVETAAGRRLVLFDSNPRQLHFTTSTPKMEQRPLEQALADTRDGCRAVCQQVNIRTQGVIGDTIDEYLERFKYVFTVDYFAQYWHPLLTSDIAVQQKKHILKHDLFAMVRKTLQAGADDEHMLAVYSDQSFESPLDTLKAFWQMYETRPTLIVINPTVHAMSLQQKEWGRIVLPPVFNVLDDPNLVYHFRDMVSGEIYRHTGAVLIHEGLPVGISPWKAQFLVFDGVSNKDSDVATPPSRIGGAVWEPALMVAAMLLISYGKWVMDKTAGGLPALIANHLQPIMVRQGKETAFAAVMSALPSAFNELRRNGMPYVNKGAFGIQTVFAQLRHAVEEKDTKLMEPSTLRSFIAMIEDLPYSAYMELLHEVFDKNHRSLFPSQARQVKESLEQVASFLNTNTERSNSGDIVSFDVRYEYGFVQPADMSDDIHEEYLKRVQLFSEMKMDGLGNGEQMISRILVTVHDGDTSKEVAISLVDNVPEAYVSPDAHALATHTDDVINLHMAALGSPVILSAVLTEEFNEILSGHDGETAHKETHEQFPHIAFYTRNYMQGLSKVYWSTVYMGVFPGAIIETSDPDNVYVMTAKHVSHAEWLKGSYGIKGWVSEQTLPVTFANGETVVGEVLSVGEMRQHVRVLTPHLAMFRDADDVLLLRVPRRHISHGTMSKIHALPLALPDTLKPGECVGTFAGRIGQWKSGVVQGDIFLDTHDNEAQLNVMVFVIPGDSGSVLVKIDTNTGGVVAIGPLSGQGSFVKPEVIFKKLNMYVRPFEQGKRSAQAVLEGVPLPVLQNMLLTPHTYTWRFRPYGGMPESIRVSANMRVFSNDLKRLLKEVRRDSNGEIFLGQWPLLYHAFEGNHVFSYLADMAKNEPALCGIDAYLRQWGERVQRAVIYASHDDVFLLYRELSAFLEELIAYGTYPVDADMLRMQSEVLADNYEFQYMDRPLAARYEGHVVPATMKIGLKLLQGHPLVVASNQSSYEGIKGKAWAYVSLPDELDIQDDPNIMYHFRNVVTGEVYTYSGETLRTKGLTVGVEPWDTQFLMIEDIDAKAPFQSDSLSVSDVPMVESFMTEMITGDTESRFAAIGDVHGELDDCRTSIRATGFVNDKDEWCVDDAELVFTGDIGHGPQLRETYAYIKALARQASARNSRIVWTVGNHDLFADIIGQGGPDSAGYALWPEIVRIITGEVSVRGLTIQGAYAAHNKIFVHGGIQPHIIEQAKKMFQADEVSTDEVVAYVNQILRDTLADPTTGKVRINEKTGDVARVSHAARGIHEIFYPGTAHAEHPILPDEKGYVPAGPFTTDISEMEYWRYYAPESLYSQVVGHTRSTKGIIRYAPNKQVIYIDVGRDKDWIEKTHGVLKFNGWAWFMFYPNTKTCKLIHVTDTFSASARMLLDSVDMHEMSVQERQACIKDLCARAADHAMKQAYDEQSQKLKGHVASSVLTDMYLLQSA